MTDFERELDQDLSLLTKQFWGGSIFWTLMLIALLIWSAHGVDQEILRLAHQEALSNFNKDKVFREWATRHGGVYVFESEITPPSPWLKHLPDRMIDLPQGDRLVLLNPATMLRQMMEQYSGLYGVKGRITSFDPLNPGNEPDEWEKDALLSFQQGNQEKVSITTIAGEPYYRLIRPMEVMAGCLKCHAHQGGYVVGKTRGGVGVSVPLKSYYAVADSRKSDLWISFIIIWAFGLILIVLIYLKGRQRAADRKQSNEKLLIARRHAEDANHAKDEFLATMSHEMRTPLACILGYCEIMMGETDDPAQLQNLQYIQLAGQNQLALVNDLLDISKIEFGKIDIDEHYYSLSMLLHNAVTMMSIKASDAGLALTFEQKQPVRFMLLGDSQRIEQILLNLLSNAIKFTETGSVTLITDIVDGMLQFTVMDTGIGIKPETLEKLFDRFEQEDNSISRRFGGSGLGLNISKRLAEMMGGEITVTSELGKGSTFIFRIPYRPTDEQDDQATDQQKCNQPETEIGQLSGHILLAEDTPAMQMLIRRIVEKYGVTVTVVETGRQAVEQAESEQFDLILMDMQMPEMNGVEACRIIKSSNNPVPVIALTANVMQQHRDAFEEAGCDGFLGKPIDRNELRRALNQYLA